MNAKDVIRSTIETSHSVLQMYLADLSDQDLLVRPLPGANHIAWQLGHLIGAEHAMASAAGAMPALPEGFNAGYMPDTAGSDDPAGFLTKARYLELLEQQRAGTLAALAAVPDAGLDEPSPESMRAYAPTIGAVFNMVGIHEMMHAAQFALVRRRLGKPPLF